LISVLERRAEVELRRSLGATCGQIWLQFLTESLPLSALGGVGGVLLGIAVTIAYASYYQGWPSVVPAWASVGGVAATLIIGGIAGLYPAWRAARLAPPKPWPPHEYPIHGPSTIARWTRPCPPEGLSGSYRCVGSSTTGLY
jgi:ABC-type lipoprotein release transport system permease subunit